MSARSEQPEYNGDIEMVPPVTYFMPIEAPSAPMGNARGAVFGSYGCGTVGSPTIASSGHGGSMGYGGSIGIYGGPGGCYQQSDYQPVASQEVTQPSLY